MAPIRYISAGTQWAFVGLLGATGRFIGMGNLTAGLAGEAMRQVLGIQTANPGPVEPEVVNIEGDDGTLGAIQFDPAETPQWVMEVGAADLELQAILQGTQVLAFGDVQFGVLQPNAPARPDVCFIYQSRLISKDASTSGASGWAGYIIPRATVTPLGRAAFAGRQAANDRYQVVAQVSNVLPFGISITDTNLGTTGAPIIPFTADNPVTMHAFISNGSSGPYALAHTPASQAKTRVINTATNAVLTAGTDYTVSAANRTITFTPALGSGTPFVVFYEIAL